MNIDKMSDIVDKSREIVPTFKDASTESATSVLVDGNEL